jgi:hypothetical protein
MNFINALLHSISSEFLLSSIERTQNIHILPVLNVSLNAILFMDYERLFQFQKASKIFPLFLLPPILYFLSRFANCKSDFLPIFSSIFLLIQVFFDNCSFRFNHWNRLFIKKSNKGKQMIIQIRKESSVTLCYSSLVLYSFRLIFLTSLLL